MTVNESEGETTVKRDMELSPKRARSRSYSRSPSPRQRSSRRDTRSRSRSRSPSHSPNRYPRKRSRSPSTSPRRRDDRRRRRDDREAPPPANVLGCFNLSLRTTSRDLEDLFGQYGEIKECTVVYDHYTRQSRGFGFITFATVDQAAAARAAVDKMVLHDRPMRVDFSLTLRPHNPTPGQYMGRDFRRRGHGGGGGGRDSYRDSHRERYPPRDDYPRERDPYRRREPSYSPPRRSRRSPSPRRRRSPSRD